MAKKREEKQPREYTKRQLSHHKKQQRRQRFIFFGGLSVIVVIVLLIMSGWLFGEYLPLNRTVIKVYDVDIPEQTLVDLLVWVGQMQLNSGQGVTLETQVDSIMNAMIQNELMRQAAEKLGVTVSEEEINKQIEISGYPNNEAGRMLIQGNLLANKLQTEYFDTQVPLSDEQVMVKAMLVEDVQLASEIRDRIIAGDNFTAMVEEYALDTVSKDNKGEYDWHPKSLLELEMTYAKPAEWAFQEDVKKGDICENLSDNTTSKQAGYWIIRVMERQDIDVAVVETLLLADKYEALDIKSRLESGDNITQLAQTFSQYSPSASAGGQLGTVAESDNISDVFNEYVFHSEIELGKWSEPIRDTRYWTKGGAWVVQVVDKEADRPLSDDDRGTLIYQAFNDWSNSLWLNAAANIGQFLSEDQRAWTIEKALKKLTDLLGG